MNIIINKATNTPVYLQVAKQIKLQILKEELPGGYALPSERSLAADLHIHRNTVTKAYNELKADGLILSHQGVGYKVVFGHEESDNNAGRKGKVNWENLIKDKYQDMGKTFDELFYHSYRDQLISFAGGMAATDIYNKEDIADTFFDIIKGQAESKYFYSPYRGDELLIDKLVDFVRKKGIITSRGQLQILSETNQAIDFLTSVFLLPGDKVLTEEPISPDVYRAIELAGAQAVTVPMDDDGIICSGLEKLIELHKPKFLFINGSFHDPRCTVTSLPRKREILDISYKYRLPIIEEDAASELNYDRPPMTSFKSLDKADNVIYIYSFSLTFIPGMDIAFVTAPKPVINALSYLVSIRLVSLEWLPQKLLYNYMCSGLYDRKLKEIKEEYQSKRDLMCDCLEKLVSLGLEYTKPAGGVYVWCRLPKGVRALKLLEATEKKGVSFMPGELFYPGKGEGDNYMRLNYSYPNRDQIKEGMRILSLELKKTLQAHDF